MFELLTSVMSGGATGLLGIALQRFADHKAKKLDIEIVKLNHENALQLATIESERLRARLDTDLQKDRVEAETETHKSDNQLVEASYQHDQATYLAKDAQKQSQFAIVLMTLVDFMRGVLRPGMTAYLCVLVTYMFLWVRSLAESYGALLSPADTYAVMKSIVDTILYVFTSVSVWWFGSRPKRG
jgi:hypothetical protein